VTSLRETGLPAVVRGLVRARRTGVLRLRRGEITKSIYLSGGRMIFAASGDPDDRLGERLLAKGLITYRAYEESVRALREGKRQGTILVENGAIRSRDLVSGVTEQVREIIYGLFAWDDGEWTFQEGDLPSREVIVLRMSTADLVMEGVRRIAAWSRIRAGVGPLEQRYALSADAASIVGAMNLLKPEMNLVATLDGPATLEEICAGQRQSDFATCRAVWGLWTAGVFDRIPQDVEATPPLPEVTQPHAEMARGGSLGREIALFNEQHQLLFELVNFELRERAPEFFERALGRLRAEQPALFAGVALEPSGRFDAAGLRRNVIAGEIASYVRGLERLLTIEDEMLRRVVGPKKAAIIQDGLIALRAQQVERAAARAGHV
jgi:hypothetical protein